MARPQGQERSKAAAGTKSRRRRSLESVVGASMYRAWTEMLRELVPHGRTQRLSVLIAGMLQYAAAVASRPSTRRPAEGSAADSLLLAWEGEDPDRVVDALSDLVEGLFRDAGVPFKRTDHRGTDYSIVEEAINEFMRLGNMPWE